MAAFLCRVLLSSKTGLEEFYKSLREEDLLRQRGLHLAVQQLSAKTARARCLSRRSKRASLFPFDLVPQSSPPLSNPLSTPLQLSYKTAGALLHPPHPPHRPHPLPPPRNHSPSPDSPPLLLPPNVHHRSSSYGRESPLGAQVYSSSVWSARARGSWMAQEVRLLGCWRGGAGELMGWERSFHTFSFANYQDSKFDQWASLRVINEVSSRVLGVRRELSNGSFRIALRLGKGLGSTIIASLRSGATSSMGSSSEFWRTFEGRERELMKMQAQGFAGVFGDFEAWGCADDEYWDGHLALGVQPEPFCSRPLSPDLGLALDFGIKAKILRSVRSFPADRRAQLTIGSQPLYGRREARCPRQDCRSFRLRRRLGRPRSDWPCSRASSCPLLLCAY